MARLKKRPRSLSQEQRLAARMHREMLAKLRQNHSKPGWKYSRDELDDGTWYLICRLKEEVGELTRASCGRDPAAAWKEAADVANFAAMLADNVHTTAWWRGRRKNG